MFSQINIYVSVFGPNWLVSTEVASEYIFNAGKKMKINQGEWNMGTNLMWIRRPASEKSCKSGCQTQRTTQMFKRHNILLYIKSGYFWYLCPFAKYLKVLLVK